MNKLIIGIAIALFAIIGGIAAYIIMLSPSSSNNTNLSAEANKFSSCDILTEEIAKSLLGDELDHPSDGTGDTSTPDLAVSTCHYVTKVNPEEASKDGLPKSSGVSLLARVAKTQAGADSNQHLFNNYPAGGQEVEGIGDKAFYSPDFRQLNVLKGNNWYVVTHYVDVITNASLESNKKLAEKLHFR